LIQIKKPECFLGQGQLFSARLITTVFELSSTWRTLPWLKM
jgi:hypothetical protein